MEASALISEKAHEDANIIVGALFDDSLGDEMRVTVIATGIGQEESEVKKPLEEQPLRGKIRDITPEDMDKIIDYDEPTFIRQKRAVGESSGAVYRGTSGVIIDECKEDGIWLDAVCCRLSVVGGNS